MAGNLRPFFHRTGRFPVAASASPFINILKELSRWLGPALLFTDDIVLRAKSLKVPTHTSGLFLLREVLPLDHAMAAGVQSLPVSSGAVNGARAAYELHIPDSQEVCFQAEPTRMEVVNFLTANCPPCRLLGTDCRQNALGAKSAAHSAWSHPGPRAPLTNVAANWKNTQEGLQVEQPKQNRIEERGSHNRGKSRSGSDGDSLLELYGRNTTTGSGHLDGHMTDQDIPENMYRPENDDPEGWIHRDKLARIEREELQAAGIDLANARRGITKSIRRGLSRDGNVEATIITEQRTTKPVLGEHPQHTTPPANDPTDDDRRDWDLRNPDEIAEDETAGLPLYPAPVIRQPGSRIPVLMSSPLPVSRGQADRETPSLRKRTISGSMSPEESLSGTKSARPRRSNSAGSPLLLDDSQSTTQTPSSISRFGSASKTVSPSKSKFISTPSPTTQGTRKPITSATRQVSSASKSGGSTHSAGQQRPATRPGDLERSRPVINRPEGDPPWLATMYKPDPMLPPDQQIIPTHARRQQQEQWNEQGAIPNTYDRNFTPLSVHANGSAGQHPQDGTNNRSFSDGLADETDIGNNSGQSWPLKPATPSPSPRPQYVPQSYSNSLLQEADDGKGESAPSPAAGYTTLSPFVGGSSGLPVRPTTSSRSIKEKTVRDVEKANLQSAGLSVKEDDDKVDKGCGCCIIM